MQHYFGPQANFRACTSPRLLRLHAAFEDKGLGLSTWRAHTGFTLTGRAARGQLNDLEGAIAAANDFGTRIVCIQQQLATVEGADVEMPIIERLVDMAINGLDSKHSKRAYQRALDDFLAWYADYAAASRS